MRHRIRSRTMVIVLGTLLALAAVTLSALPRATASAISTPGQQHVAVEAVRSPDVNTAFLAAHNVLSGSQSAARPLTL